MATTYCTRADLESIIGVASVFTLIDDNLNGIEDAAETLYIASAIERAAVELNTAIQPSGYEFSSLTNNAWCKWCNAYLACYYLAARKNNPPAASVVEAVQRYREQLEQLKWGRFHIPEQNPDHEDTPTVTNFRPELNKVIAPIRVVTEESTGAAPEGSRKRNTAFQPDGPHY